MPNPGAVRTTCPYCGVGCGILATREANGSVQIAGDPDHPANFGRLCSKGSALGETLSLDGRLLFPQVAGRRASWDSALDLVATTFERTIAEHGPDAVAIYGSGQLLTEDYYVANKLMKGFVGSANIDTNSRLCMASSVAGHKRAFGADAVPGNYEDLELADLVVLVGSNLAWCHPVLYQRIVKARAERPEMRVVVIDPRRTATAEEADLHLPIRPDGDVALFVGLLGALAAGPAFDAGFVAGHTNGFAAALDVARAWPLDRVATATGLDARQVAYFYDMVAAHTRTVTVFSQGVNQSATGSDKVNAIINCHLATGRIGRPGMGPFSVTGQPNAMGGREVGGLANMLAAHMDFEPHNVDRLRRFWGSPRVAERPGLKAVDLFAAVADGRIKALWIMATNPVDSMPESNALRDALRRCPFVVVSDMNARTDTAIEADVLLPAAGWGEKAGTVTNSERRISRQRPFLPLPGEARPDWWIVTEVAHRMGFGEAFPYGTAAEIFAEHVALSAFENDGTRDFDLSGLGSAGYDFAPVQWPVRHEGTARLFADRRFHTPDARAVFVPVSPPPPLVPPPGMLVLNTGRVRDHWHTMTRTGKTPRLSAHFAEPFAEISPADAAERGIRHASLVRLENRQGSALVRALVTTRQQRGSLFAPMHWTGQFSAAGRIDALVEPRTDPQSGQPALKMSFVAAEPVRVRRYGFAVSRLRPSLDCAYWSIASAAGGWRTEFAFLDEPADVGAWLREAFRLPSTAAALTATDATTGRESLALFDGDVLQLAVYLSPDPVLVSRSWAASLLAGSIEAGARANVLAGRPGSDRPDPGPIVCACFQVGAGQVAKAIHEGCDTVDAIGAALEAGTNCGSCRAELRLLLAQIPAWPSAKGDPIAHKQSRQ
jgi:assimilatory nitrate reductase catalytic subunit